MGLILLFYCKNGTSKNSIGVLIVPVGDVKFQLVYSFLVRHPDGCIRFKAASVLLGDQGKPAHFLAVADPDDEYGFCCQVSGIDDFYGYGNFPVGFALLGKIRFQESAVIL